MIPVELRLQNFMAYKTPQTLSFADIHLACLTGENGAGKSTLLDAITWALWGKARTRLDDDLIHLGESEMEVAFTFALGGETYRVLRRRIAGKRGRSELHFHAFLPAANDWRTLTESGIRQTQDKINRLLRLDYDTFINSAFLLQGRADEFTNKRPAERKQILGDILGLGIYDEYEERAAEKTRLLGQEIRILEAQIEQMEGEMANEAAYRTEWEEAQNRAADLHKALRAAETTLADLRQRHKELDIKQRQLDDLQTRLRQAQTDLDDLTAAIAQIEKRIAGYRAVIARAGDIETGYANLQRAQAELEDWNQRLAQSAGLRNEVHRLETAIQHARAALEADLKVKQARLKDLQAKAEGLDKFRANVARLQAEQARLQAQEAERDRLREEQQTLATEAARLTEENKQHRAEMDKIRARLDQLEAAGSTCPVCAQPLSDEHRATVRRQFTAEGTAHGDAYRANEARLQEIQAEQKRLTAAIRQAERTLKQLPALQRQLAQAEHTLQEAEDAAARIAALQAERDALQKRLDEADFAPQERAELARLQAELAQVGYDADAHAAARTAVADLTPYADEYRRLEDARTRLSEEEARRTQEEARRQRLLAQTETDRATVAALTAETAALPQLTAELTAASTRLDDLQRQERLARDAVAAARQKLDHLAYLAKERGKKEAALAELKETREIYTELRAAFGKRGVQALLIEHAIPELEQEANHILTRMTDGRVNLQFITQRATRTTGSPIETLDIRIADELGTRNYDLYSGGEAFRINFAIRIALSKLLARRAGASLQTLVIDEGFGTQDAQGRERLVEAINAIQSDFEKIIVITHLDELQDAFPVRIHVRKTEAGSVISVD
ncbi:MAG: SMC family ATPase [Caldilineae bacterium]|nr:MAG: SMC family ATPase [Caldilineae bacterium]